MSEHTRFLAKSRQNWQKKTVNNINTSKYYNQCENILQGLAQKYLGSAMTLIDLGCADGRYTETMAQYAKNAIGYEYSQSMLAKAQEERASEKIAFHPIDLEHRNWILPPCQLAMCMGVLTYIHEDDQMTYILEKIEKSLSEGNGQILITRESLSKNETFRHMTQGLYYSIYRSHNDYFNSFIKCGFELEDAFKLFEDKYVINAFRIWRRKIS